MGQASSKFYHDNPLLKGGIWCINRVFPHTMWGLEKVRKKLVGTFRESLYLSLVSLILEDCLYVPNVRRNLISATYLGKHEYCVILKDNVVIKKDKVFIRSGKILWMVFIF